jgi:Icc-related predicted phosphoesterase
MKFGILSDLHMEFDPWFFEPDPDVFYLNAGDTHPHTIVREYFNELMGDNYLYVYGNHDYYGQAGSELFKKASDHVFTKEVNGIKIAGATLWTDITPVRWWDFKEYMMDTKYIKSMNYDRYMNAHKAHHDFLFNSDADIWVVHHLPSFQSVHEKYLGSNGNDFFATELSRKILEMRKPPKLIVHGHTHEKMDYMIGDTRVICHPRGYPNENAWFQTYQPLILEIE